MKKLFLMLFACVMSVASFAQDQTITFDKYTHNFGSFSEANSTQKCTFTFTNTGSTPLVIYGRFGGESVTLKYHDATQGQLYTISNALNL